MIYRIRKWWWSLRQPRHDDPGVEAAKREAAIRKRQHKAHKHLVARARYKGLQREVSQ